ncbi:MAG: beta-propeller domain-containing protein [Thermoleophilia bacterium]
MTVVRTPSMPRCAALAALAAAALAIALPAAAPAAAKRPVKPSALPAFPSCKSLLGYARRNARRTGGRTGVPSRAGVLQPQVLASPAPTEMAMPSVAAQPAPATAADRGGGQSAVPDFSSTNVQEAGVDEPDIVKTDGRTLFAVAEGRLHAVDVTADRPRPIGSLALDGSHGHQLLMCGDRLLVMGSSFGGRPITSDVIVSASQVVLSEVDIGDPAQMKVLRTMTIEGALVDARLSDGTARVVVGASPDPIRPAAIATAPVRRFVPRTVIRSRVSGRSFRRSVAACDEIRRPRRFSGLDLLTVLTVDMDKGLYDVDRDAIMAGAQTVYASASGLYVASQRYVAALEAGRSVPEASRTEIHRFDASKAGETSYAASGSVVGFVLDQYSLSEFDGALRVASTEQPAWFDGRIARDSESFVTVLAQRGSQLALLGRAEGLGRGERIYAVRFAGDQGYVVTFRQVDPLYTLDLSRKTDPRVVGELKILGYSAYLHPISDDLLLGIGQDASAQGRVQGTQLSLFDVSDPRRPARRAQASLGAGASSTAEFDPHAFLFWKPASLAVVPLAIHGDRGQRFEGAVGFSVAAGAIAEAGRISHPPRAGDDHTPPIGRSLVIGRTLYTLSYAGLAANSVDGLAPLSFTAFAP